MKGGLRRLKEKVPARVRRTLRKGVSTATGGLSEAFYESLEERVEALEERVEALEERVDGR